MVTYISMKQGEERIFTFTVKKPDGTPTNLTGSTLTYTWKTSYTGVAVLTKTDAMFGKTQQVNGVVTCTVTAIDTATLSGNYYTEFKADFGSGNIRKSDDIMVAVGMAVS